MKNFFKSIAKNWQTTLAGVIVIGGGVVKIAAPQFSGAADLAQGAALGVGLISAADATKFQSIFNVVKGVIPAKPEEKK
jgi:hypothetical protein